MNLTAMAESSGNFNSAAYASKANSVRDSDTTCFCRDFESAVGHDAAQLPRAHVLCRSDIGRSVTM